jgi:type IV pilus assembly protein PilE
MRKTIHGVSLIELMTVVLIIGILASMAYPSYRQYLARAKRVEAKSALIQIATLQERFYIQNHVYTEDMTNLGFPVGGNFLTDSKSYNVDVTAADASTFSATATYQKADAEAGKCATFSIDGTAARTSTPFDDCWTNTRR